MNYRFNLQPWREVERQGKKKNFIAITSMIFLGAIAVIGANYYLEKNYIEEQQRTKNYLNSQISQLQPAKKEVENTKSLIKEINRQIQAIEKLQSQRGIALKMLDYLAINTPSNVFINHVAFNGIRIEIDGVAENDTGVADFMRILQSNELLSVAILREIQTAKSTGRYEVTPSSETKSFTVVANLDLYKGEPE